MPMTERIDWSDLRDLYEVKRLGRRAIAKLKGCHPHTVLAAMRRHGVRPRTLQESTKKGPSHHSFKHGKMRGGYYRGTLNGKRVRIHRLIAQKVLGRPLTAREVVHHTTTPDDVDPNNLWVFPNQSAHITYHNSGTIHPDTIFLKDHLK
jgi:hypothetical protein